MYDTSGEHLVHPANQQFFGQTFNSEFEVGEPTSEDDVEKKKKRSTKIPVKAVLESFLLSIPYRRFSFRSVASVIFLQVMLSLLRGFAERMMF